MANKKKEKMNGVDSTTAQSSEEPDITVDDISADDIHDKVESNNKVNIFPDKLGDAKEIGQVYTLTTAHAAATALGIDLSDKEAVNAALVALKESLNNPENTKETIEIMSALAQNFGLYLEASEPFIDPFISVVVDANSMLAEQIIDSASTIVGNMVKEIPGVGLMVAGLQNAQQTAETAYALANAATSVVKEGAQFVQSTNENIKRLKSLRQKRYGYNKDIKNAQLGGGGDVSKRVIKSINDFLTPTITLSKVKKMYETRKRKNKKNTKTNKRRK